MGRRLRGPVQECSRLHGAAGSRRCLRVPASAALGYSPGASSAVDLVIDAPAAGVDFAESPQIKPRDVMAFARWPAISREKAAE
jgi:hypothetical protein